jgi:hypothetical protein
MPGTPAPAAVTSPEIVPSIKAPRADGTAAMVAKVATAAQIAIADDRGFFKRASLGRLR